MSTQPYKAGARVRIRPEWCDIPEGAARVYVVVNPEEKGRLDISPEVWTHGDFKPVETVRPEMICPA